MIKLTKLNEKQFYLNCELIESIESTPDTVILLRNGKVYIVKETTETVVGMANKYKQNLFANLCG